MKKLILLLIGLSCGLIYAQRKPKIKGNKSVVEVRESLGDFSRIELRDDLELSLQKSVEPGYSIIADDNLIDILKFEVKDSTLIISSFYNITAKKQLEISVRYNTLESIRIDAGSMESEATVVADQIRLISAGNARTDLQISASVAIVELESNSKGRLNIDADSVSVTLMDKAAVELYATTEQMVLEMQNNTLAELEGSSENAEYKLNGGSKLRAEEMEVVTTSLEATDNSTARVRSTGAFGLAASVNAKVYLYGEPEIVIEEFRDSAELHKRPD